VILHAWKEDIPFNSSTWKRPEETSTAHIEKVGELKEKIFLFEDRRVFLEVIWKATTCSQER